jgi:cytosine/creatinine deaminase
MMDKFIQAAIEEARIGQGEGGIPIGSVLVHQGRIVGRGHNRRVQRGSAILHAEMDALENAGRQPASIYRESVLYTTLSPCAMCSGAILLYGIPKVIIGENQTFLGEEAFAAIARGRGGSSAGCGLHGADAQLHCRASRAVERRHRRHLTPRALQAARI